MTKLEKLRNRLNQGLASEAEIARRAGLSRSNVAAIRKGDTKNPGTETLDRLQRAFRQIAAINRKRAARAARRGAAA